MYVADCTKSAKKLTENGSHLEFLINTWCYHIYNIPIGFSDLENVGLDTKFVFLGWPKAKIWAIQFSEDFDGGHFEKCPKRWGCPTYKVLTSRLFISGVHWTKWYHSWRILWGCTVTPLGPWTIYVYYLLFHYTSASVNSMFTHSFLDLTRVVLKYIFASQT